MARVLLVSKFKKFQAGVECHEYASMDGPIKWGYGWFGSHE
jgi:hypothetical protein